MASETDDVVLRILKQIQATQANHTREFERVQQEFRKVHQEIADLRDTTVSAAGLSVHANVKTNTLPITCPN